MRRLLPLFMLLILLTQFGLGYGDVKSVEIEPENPVQGDVISIRISANPNEELDVEISFTKSLAVSDGRYELRLEDVVIPSTPNSFRVEAVGVVNLHISVKFFGLWVTKSVGAVEGVASLSQGNVPKGTYDVVIRGEAEEGVSEVELRVKAAATITTDSNGLYEFRYDTSCIPPGRFTVKIDGYRRTLTLGERGSTVSPPISVPSMPQRVTPTLIETSSLEEALRLLGDLEVEEVAEILSKVSAGRAGEILSALEVDRAVEVFGEMPLNASIKVILETNPDRAVELLERISIDRGVEVLGGVVSEGYVDRAVELLSSMEIDRGAELLFGMDAASACEALEALSAFDLSFASSLIEYGIEGSLKGSVEVLEDLDDRILASILIEMVRG